MTTGKYELVIRWPSGQSTLCGEMTDHQHGQICRILSPDYRAKNSPPIAAQLGSCAPGIAEDLERSDWTPEEALRWYAAGKHFDTFDNRTRIIDTGAIASNALKHASLQHLELKGDAELSELRAEVEALRKDADRYRWMRSSFVRNHKHSLIWYLPMMTPLTAEGLDEDIDKAISRK